MTISKSKALAALRDLTEFIEQIPEPREGAVLFISVNGREVVTWQEAGLTQEHGKHTLHLIGAALADGLEFKMREGQSVDVIVGSGPDTCQFNGKVTRWGLAQRCGDITTWEAVVVEG